MDMILTILIIILLLNIAFFAYFIIQKNNDKSGDDKEQNLLIQQLGEFQRSMDSKMNESQKMMNESVSDQFNKSQNLMSAINKEMSEHLMKVTKGVTEANESGKQIFDVAQGLKNLEKVLKHQKQRGNLGEASLELILNNILPPNAYEMQYRFKSGEAVDAIIKTKEGFIPVDAKYSLDNYERLINCDDEDEKKRIEKEFSNDLKKRIDETSKYIKEEEGTLPFAFMFIPAEGMYYDLLVNQVGAIKSNSRSLLDYAYNDKKVMIVSPTTFSAYLQSVLYGFKAFKIEESAKEIQKHVRELQKHLGAYDEYHQKLGNTISTVVNHYNNSNKEFKKIDKDILKISGDNNSIETETVERPILE